MLECFLYIQFYSDGEPALEISRVCVANYVQPHVTKAQVIAYARNVENGADAHMLSSRDFRGIDHASAWCRSEAASRYLNAILPSMHRMPPWEVRESSAHRIFHAIIHSHLHPANTTLQYHKKAFPLF